HKSYEFNNRTAQQIIDELVKPYNIKFTIEGGQLPSKPLDRYSVAPGTTVMEAVEQVLRRTSNGTQLTSNLNSDLVAVVAPTTVQGTVREGVDILEGREIIFNPSIYKGIITIGQGQPNDQNWGPAVTQMQQQNSGQSTGGQGTQVIPMEGPASNATLTARGNMDREFQSRDQVTVFATVQGWLRPDGALWERSPRQ